MKAPPWCGSDGVEEAPFPHSAASQPLGMLTVFLLLPSCLPSPCRRDDFFFLTDPEHFIETHWPEDPRWQLLQPPVSREDFEQRVFKTSEFFRLQLSLLSPNTSLLKTGRCKARDSSSWLLRSKFGLGKILLLQK